jgi:hypothetical protein
MHMLFFPYRSSTVNCGCHDACGDLIQKINSMVSMVDGHGPVVSLASEMTGVALEVGTQGILGGQTRTRY